MTSSFFTDIRSHDAFSVERLDVRDLDALRSTARAFGPTHIFHFAAETSLERCEEHVDQAWSTNAIGTQNAALVAAEFDVPLTYLNEPSLFDQTKQEPYTEFDQPTSPCRSTSATKFEGKRASWPVVQELYRARRLDGGVRGSRA